MASSRFGKQKYEFLLLLTHPIGKSTPTFTWIIMLAARVTFNLIFILEQFEQLYILVPSDPRLDGSSYPNVEQKVETIYSIHNIEAEYLTWVFSINFPRATPQGSVG